MVLPKLSAKPLSKLKAWLFIKVAPNTITLVARDENTPYAYTPQFYKLEQQFDRAGFERGRHYHNVDYAKHNLATFYKDGICGVINSEGKRDWIELFATFTDRSFITVSSDEKTLLFNRMPKQDYVLINKDDSVEKAEALLAQNRRDRQLDNIEDKHFTKMYADFYHNYLMFLKGRY